MINKVRNGANDTPVILSGLVDAQHAHEVKQDPNNDNSKTLLRSINENGIEYSYSTWLYINGETWANSSNGKWKHVMHKGPHINSILDGDEPDVISPIQAPGLWIHPTSNVLRLYVNTYDTNTEYVEISNLPVRKWINLVYTQTNFTSNVYINGRLKSSHELKTLPRQNYYNLYITQDGGFNGYMSTTQYFNYTISSAKINDLAMKGPSLEKHKEKNRFTDQIDLKHNVPYLSNRWWVSDHTYN
tara:strand:- start:10596 stop:11327 length:732 start_codon:yes stop_codon:yes gene_type:complete